MQVNIDLDDDLFASTDLEISVPKYRIPERENDPRHAYQIVADALLDAPADISEKDLTANNQPGDVRYVTIDW